MTSDTFQMFIKSNPDKVLLLEFWAENCAACGLMKYTLRQTKPIWETTMTLAGINTKLYPQLAEINEVTAVPTLLVFYNERCIHRMVGAIRPDAFMKRIQDILNDIREDKYETFSQH